MDGGPEKGAGNLPSRREVPALLRPLGPGRWLRPSAGSLCRRGQHRAPTPAAPAVHHAPGGPGRGGRSRGHQLCLRSPPRLLQLLRQLHEPGGRLQPHEPRQQRPVASGRGPRLSVQGPRGQRLASPSSEGSGGHRWLSLGEEVLVSATSLAVGQLERVCVGGGVGGGLLRLHLSLFCEPFTPGLSSASPVTPWAVAEKRFPYFSPPRAC